MVEPFIVCEVISRHLSPPNPDLPLINLYMCSDLSLMDFKEDSSQPEARLQKAISDDLDDVSVSSWESGDEDFENPLHERFDTDALTDIKFTYDGLDQSAPQIRVLVLHPASNKRADIHCTLEQVPVASNPVYEALSYTWGSTEQKCIIHVNGRPFIITRNLDIALRYLRSYSETRVLWIDAICINQSDLREKSQQVMRMADTYRNATRVLVWLGESDKATRKAIALLQHEHDIDNAPRNSDSLGISDSLELKRLFGRPWWTRMWVVQEVVAARQPPLVGCGRLWVSWGILQSAMETLARNEISLGMGSEDSTHNPTALVYLAAMNRFEYPQQTLRILEELLLATCDRQTTLPHDAVFALLGLTSQDVLQEVPIDYDQPFEVVFQKTMAYVLATASHLNFLIEAMDHHKDSTPSWCVDFSQLNWNHFTNHPEGPSLFDGEDGHMRGPGASGRQLKSSILHNIEKGTLKISGNEIGRVLHCNISKCRSVGHHKGMRGGPHVRSLSKNDRHNLRLTTIKSVVEDMQAFAIAAKAALKVRFGELQANKILASGEAWKTMYGGIPFDKFTEYFERLNGKQIPSLPDSYSALEEFLQSRNDTYRDLSREWFHGESTYPDLPSHTNFILTNLFRIGLSLFDKTLITTDTGYLGRAPSASCTIQQGDIICILHGCRVPAVLRPVGQMYKLITFSYVSGVMKGEYYEGCERPAQDFVLC